MNVLQILLIILISYMFGSLPTAYLLTLFIKHINIFEVGSGNMGGTNVARTMGLHWGIITSILDGCKGMAAVAVAEMIIPSHEWRLVAAFIAAIAAVAGHNWSFFATWLYSHYNKTFAIRGGKGAATAFGTMIMLAPFEACVMLLVIGVSLAIITRYASLSVLISFAASLTYTAVWSVENNFILYIPYVILLTVLILWRFRENIQRLVTGTERKLGERVA